MKVGVVVGCRYLKVGDQYYTTTSYHSEMWKKYLGIFDGVVILDQVQEGEKLTDGHKPILTDNVELVEYPTSRTFWQLLFHVPKMFVQAYKASRKADFWMLHSPSTSGIILWFWLMIFRIPYSLELRGEHILNVNYLKCRGIRGARFIVGFYKFTFWLVRTRAIGSVSVAKFLAEEYPPLRKGSPNLAISDSKVPLEYYRQPRKWSNDFEKRTIICLSRIEAQKDPLGTMRALSMLEEKGFKDWRLLWMGDGPMRNQTQALSEKLGIADKIDLVGFVPWERVFSELEKADLYLLYSISEGMPRSMLEAMACALPCVSTNVCGMTELVEDDFLVTPGDDKSLADKLYEVLTDADKLTEMSKENCEKAKEYSGEVLAKRREDYYKQLKDIVSKKTGIE